MKRVVLIGILILITVLVVIGAIFIYPRISPPKISSSQKGILGVRLHEGDSYDAFKGPSIEVSLWRTNESSGPPIAVSRTNEEGMAIFEVPAGDYLIGFNELTFPDEFVYPEFRAYQYEAKAPIEVKSDMTVYQDIALFRK